jgi:ubiquinone/menaquinone biosynthesis C-methylase UbiE
MKTSDKQHWEKFWKTKDLKDIYPVGDRVIRAIDSKMDVRGKRILEVGAGTGRDSYQLAQKGADVYVLDYAESALDLYRKQNEDGAKSNASATAVCGDAFKLPFADDTFDVVFHQGLLEHFREHEGIVEENYRVLKPGGIVIVDVPQRWHIYTVIKHFLIAIDSWFAGWEKEFGLREVERMLERIGFEPVGFYGEWMYPTLGYRITREILWKIGIRMPLYPWRMPVYDHLLRYFQSVLPKHRFFANLTLSIGVIGRK